MTLFPFNALQKQPEETIEEQPIVKLENMVIIVSGRNANMIAKKVRAYLKKEVKEVQLKVEVDNSMFKPTHRSKEL